MNEPWPRFGAGHVGEGYGPEDHGFTYCVSCQEDVRGKHVLKAFCDPRPAGVRESGAHFVACSQECKDAYEVKQILDIQAREDGRQAR